MASLLIKNIPPALHARLKKQAAAHRRSLNSETIVVLEKAVEPEAEIPPQPAATQSIELESHLSESELAKHPGDIAARLRALRQLRESLAARNVDFDEWRRVAYDSRR